MTQDLDTRVMMSRSSYIQLSQVEHQIEIIFMDVNCLSCFCKPPCTQYSSVCLLTESGAQSSSHLIAGDMNLEDKPVNNPVISEAAFEICKYKIPP